MTPEMKRAHLAELNERAQSALRALQCGYGDDSTELFYAQTRSKVFRFYNRILNLHPAPSPPPAEPADNP